MGKSCKFSTAGMKMPLQGTIEYQAKMKSGIPGPNSYNPSDPNAKLGGGKFNKSSGMSYIDLAVRVVRASMLVRGYNMSQGNEREGNTWPC